MDPPHFTTNQLGGRLTLFINAAYTTNAWCSMREPAGMDIITLVFGWDLSPALWRRSTAPAFPTHHEEAGNEHGLADPSDDAGWLGARRVPHGPQWRQRGPAGSRFEGHADAHVQPRGRVTELARFREQRVPVACAALEQLGFALPALVQLSVPKHERSFLSSPTVSAKARRPFKRDCNARQASAVPAR